MGAQRNKCLNLEKPLIVTDNGYYNQKNMMELALRNVKFPTLVDPNIVWVRETVDALRATLAGMSGTCPFDPSICGATSLRMHRFSLERRRSRNAKVAGEKETIQRRLYAHVYYSPDNEARKELAFRKCLLELKAKIEEGETEFTKSAQKKNRQVPDLFQERARGTAEGRIQRQSHCRSKEVLRLFRPRQQSYYGHIYRT